MSDTHRQVSFDRLGGPEVLSLGRAPRRAPLAGEVELRLLAIGVTQGDAMYRRGTYLEKPALPSGIGTEACGVVEVCGPGVTAFRPGDRVSSLSTFSINRYPLYGERAVLPESALIPTPEALSDEAGAAFALAYLPMYLALVREAQLKVGEWVVLNAAAATTSLAAHQIAQLAGARTIGVVRSAAKAQALRDLGFDEVLVDGDGLAARVVEITGGGADVVLDPVLGPQAERLGAMMARRGRIIHYGALGGPTAAHSIYQLAPKFLKVMGFTIYGYSGSLVMNIPRDEEGMAEARRFVSRGVASGALRPTIAQVLPLDQVVAAHQALESGSHVGKIVLVP
jgi:NADPH:quinone reductase-like Zn-dependent oxidoreductase